MITVWETLDRCWLNFIQQFLNVISTRRCFWSKFNTQRCFHTFYFQNIWKIGWHEPSDMSTSSTTSLVVIRRVYSIVWYLVGYPDRLVIFKVFTILFETYIPYLNSCLTLETLQKTQSIFRMQCCASFSFQAKVISNSWLNFFSKVKNQLSTRNIRQKHPRMETTEN